ncbi:cytochrome P450 4C1-like isoform X2 [Phymastichus coffea]|uniref:cytochrome P450 4C1-like isoform X2 n=1 Tax=Phymastichus coffea TaxID=108790 RepID=UPI00273C5DB2|nr:cytochrome P450 4C1-like isoform X2 [Phymastichus coffea]
MIVYLISVTLLLISFHIYTRYSRFGRLINKIPGPRPLPFIGNLLQFNVSREKAWSRVCDYFDQYYPIYKLWSVTSAAVLLRHPDDLKIILSCKKNIDKCPAGYGTVKYTGNNGILFSDGDYWHPRRKILNPAFNTNLLQIYMHKICKRAAKFALDLRSQGNIIVENISPIFLKFALAAVCEAVMDFDVDSMSAEEEQRFRDTFIELSEITMYRVCRPYILDWMLPFLPIGKRLSRVHKVLDDFRTKITNERRRYHERIGHSVFKSQVDELEDGVVGDDIKGLRKNLAVVDLLLMAEQKGLIDNHGVLEEVLVVATAGFETTGMAISFLLVLLAENKNIQDLARAELLKELGKNHDGITMEHVKKLEYLERCVKESLRLYPTAPHYGRIITEDIQLRILIFGQSLINLTQTDFYQKMYKIGMHSLIYLLALVYAIALVKNSQ